MLSAWCLVLGAWCLVLGAFRAAIVTLRTITIPSSQKTPAHRRNHLRFFRAVRRILRMHHPIHAAASVPSYAGFTNDLAAHLQPGAYVISAPDYFLMFRGIPVDAPMDDILNPWRRWPEDRCDCWFIWLAAGDLLAAVDMMVAQYGAKKWFAFQRGGPPRYWRFNSAYKWVKAKAAALTAKQSNSRKKACGSPGCPHCAWSPS